MCVKYVQWVTDLKFIKGWAGKKGIVVGLFIVDKKSINYYVLYYTNDK